MFFASETMSNFNYSSQIRASYLFCYCSVQRRVSLEPRCQAQAPWFSLKVDPMIPTLGQMSIVKDNYAQLYEGEVERSCMIATIRIQ